MGISSGSRIILNGWKRIAAELGWGKRTVQRWAQFLGLPVHRLGKGPRASVFAYADELQHWLSTQGQYPKPTAVTNPNSEVRRAGLGRSIHRRREEHEGSKGNGNTLSPQGVREAAIDIKALQAVREFLATNLVREKQRSCKRCGRAMQFVDGYIWLQGGKRIGKSHYPSVLTVNKRPSPLHR